jgi:hypothetical protein
LDIIKDRPHWNIPDFAKHSPGEEDEEDDLWDVLRRYGEY